MCVSVRACVRVCVCVVLLCVCVWAGAYASVLAYMICSQKILARQEDKINSLDCHLYFSNSATESVFSDLINFND